MKVLDVQRARCFRHGTLLHVLTALLCNPGQIALLFNLLG